jgi:hypothetical protein
MGTSPQSTMKTRSKPFQFNENSSSFVGRSRFFLFFLYSLYRGREDPHAGPGATFFYHMHHDIFSTPKFYSQLKPWNTMHFSSQYLNTLLKA